jgi:predicted metal-dependent TIM-barrel fold hydrolase
VRIFEPHIHMFARTTDDYESLALAGVRALVEPSFWLGQRRTQVGTFVDYWSAIRDYEWQRAKAATIEQFHTVSVNPREANDEPLAREALAAMAPFLDHERCVAVGEIGFDDITPAEERLLAEQLVLAREKGLPALVHSCHRNKLRGTERTIEILKELDYDPARVLYDHNTEETIGLVRDYGCWAGLTVYPHTKLSPERAANILEEYGVERTMVNSSADWGPSDVLSVPRVVVELRRRGWTDDRIQPLVWNTPRAFYAQSGRLAADAAQR